MNAACVSRGSFRFAEVTPPRTGGRPSYAAPRSPSPRSSTRRSTGARRPRRRVHLLDEQRPRSGAPTLDGTGVNENFIRAGRRGQGPFGVALGPKHIYWANSAPQARSGAPTSTASSVDTAHRRPQRRQRLGMAVDSTYIYWADASPRTGSTTTRSGAPTSTARTSTSASSPGAKRPIRGGGRRAPTSTGRTTGGRDRARQPRRHGRQPGFIPAAAARGVAVDATHVYWTNTGADTIGRANLDGTAVNQGSSPVPASRRGSRSTATTSTGPDRRPPRHDRARQPRRHGRRPELHRRPAARRGGGRRGARGAPAPATRRRSSARAGPTS